MKDPTVSVIVPAFNYARFLPEALDSVLRQSFQDWECLVVDDGSTDETGVVASDYANRDGRFHVLTQANRGLASARNSGIGKSRGNFVQFLDADDRLMPTKLEEHVGFLTANEETDIVYSEVDFFRSEAPDVRMASMQGHLSRSIMARVHGAEEALRKLEHYNIMPVLAAMVRRRVFDRAGRFEESAPSCEDWGFWLRCALTGHRFDFMESNAPLASVRVHSSSMSTDHSRMTRGVIAIARSFQKSHPASAERPLICEVGLGYDDVAHGRRLPGARRIWRAAGNAAEVLTALRWRVYAIAAFLPRNLFLRLAGTPVPERPFELYRRIRSRLRSRSKGGSPQSGGADGDGS